MIHKRYSFVEMIVVIIVVKVIVVYFVVIVVIIVINVINVVVVYFVVIIVVIIIIIVVSVIVVGVVVVIIVVVVSIIITAIAISRVRILVVLGPIRADECNVVLVLLCGTIRQTCRTRGSTTRRGLAVVDEIITAARLGVIIGTLAVAGNLTLDFAGILERSVTTVGNLTVEGIRVIAEISIPTRMLNITSILTVETTSCSQLCISRYDGGRPGTSGLSTTSCYVSGVGVVVPGFLVIAAPGNIGIASISFCLLRRRMFVFKEGSMRGKVFVGILQGSVPTLVWVS